MEVDGERNRIERMLSKRRHADKMNRLTISIRFIVECSKFHTAGAYGRSTEHFMFGT